MTTIDTPTTNSQQIVATPREWIGLAVLWLPVLLLSLDTSVLNLALPSLGRDLGASSTQQLWILDIFGFVLSSFLLTMGALGDRIGRRRLLLIGAVGFGASSTMAAFSTSAGMLIASRALMGATGATLMPSALALITTMFLDAKQRSVAIAIFFSGILGGLALGPVVGGLLLHWFWWGSVFLIAIPVTVVLLVTVPLLLPEHKGDRQRLDPLSIVLSLAAVLLVTHALTGLARNGASTVRIASLVVGLALGGMFLLRQRSLTNPLVDLSLFRVRSLSPALTVLMLGGAIQGGMYLLVSLYLQTVAGLTPLHAGLLLVGPAIAMIFTIIAGPIIAAKVPPGRVIAGGLLIASIGYLTFVTADAHSLVQVVVGVALISFGSGPMVSLTSNLAVSFAPPQRAGSASAVAEAFGQFGIAFGIAGLGSIATIVYRSGVTGHPPAGLPAEAVDAIRESVISGVTVGHQLPGSVGTQVVTMVRDAFTNGIQLAGGIAGIVAISMLILAAVKFRHVPPIGPGTPGQADELEEGRDATSATHKTAEQAS